MAARCTARLITAIRAVAVVVVDLAASDAYIATLAAVTDSSVLSACLCAQACSKPMATITIWKVCWVAPNQQETWRRTQLHAMTCVLS